MLSVLTRAAPGTHVNAPGTHGMHPVLTECTRYSRNAPGTHVNAHDGQVDVVEQLVVELDRHAAAEEHHHLLLAVLLQEGEQQHKPLLRRAHHISATRGRQVRKVVIVVAYVAPVSKPLNS